MFFNLVLLGYGIPGGAARSCWRMHHAQPRPQPYRSSPRSTSIVLMLVYLTLEVRTLFQGAGAQAAAP